MHKEKIIRLEKMSGIGKVVTFRRKSVPGQADRIGIIEDEVYFMVNDYKHMIQRIKFAENVSWDGSQYGYRTGYYTYDKNMERIRWGQFTQFLTEKEYRELLSKAKAKGWDIF